MLYQLVVPGPIEDVEEVRVLEWHGTENQRLEPGDLMVELETHKAVVEIRANQSGILRSILCPAGDWQTLGESLALLSDTPDEKIQDLAGNLAAWEAKFEIT